MPRNRFPDSREKRELRRRDLRLLTQYADIFAGKLDYCGLPSVEFLDVCCWKDRIKSVTAFENEPDVYQDMLIMRDSLEFQFPVIINPKSHDNILTYLASESYSYGLYNIDLYGGMIYSIKAPAKGKASVNDVTENRSTTAFQQLFAQQSKAKQSFVLIATFNVRDTGASDYDSFLESVQTGLKSHSGIDKNIAARKKQQATRLAVCFPYFCWSQTHNLGFDQVACEATMYRSSESSIMVHFFQLFRYEGGALPTLAPTAKALEIVNTPLWEMHGQVRKRKFEFPQVR